MKDHGMNSRKQLVVFMFLLLSTSVIPAQQTINAGGGNASGIGGDISFSIGEVFFETGLQDETTFADGIQQAYEISIVIEIEDKPENLLICIFPNPHSDFLMLEFRDKAMAGQFTYRLTDTSGRVLRSSALTGFLSEIDTSGLPEAIYFLEVIPETSTESICIFKIIKTK